MTNIIIDEHNAAFINYLKHEFPTNDRNLIIIGKPGIGKTYLATKLIKHSYMIDEPTFRQRIANRDQLTRPPERRTAKIDLFPLDALSKKETVIYDDYGVGVVTEAYREKMQYRMNKRLAQGLKTVFTTNLPTKEALKERDQRIASRMFENADIYVCEGRPERRETTARLLNSIFEKQKTIEQQLLVHT